jgi:hypothetical protein
MRGWYHGGLGRAASTLLAALGTCACAAQPSPGSPARPGQQGKPAGGDTDEHPSPTRHWARMGEVRAWTPLTDGPFVSLGHPPGNQLARIHVSPEARETYQNLQPGTTLPVGAIVAELQQDAATGQPGLGYVMTKQEGGRWEFMLVKSDGEILEQGEVPPCARCHAEAVADSLFGVRAGE